MIPRMVHERRTTIGSRALRYFEAGSGRPLVLIHAFPVSAEMWRPQLDRVPDGWRFIAPDVRGFGAAAIEPGTTPTIDDYAADIIALMDMLRLDRVVMAGLSMGGYITFALRRLASDRISGLILADTRSQPDTAEALKGRRALLEKVRDRGVRAVIDELMPKLLGETSRRERADVLAHLTGLIEANAAGAIEAAIHALMSRPDSTPDLATIRCPTLVVVGEEDTITPVSEAEALQRAIAGSSLAVLPRAGHLSNLESPDEFSAALHRFLHAHP
jgi:pimeloyl-ACP methyl ester carboxylesterase